MTKRLAAACAVALLSFACGPKPAGNPAYAGTWPSFVVNGSQQLGGFSVDAGGQFNFASAGVQVTGTIEGDDGVTASAQGAGAAGICTLQGRCTSLEVCSGTAVGSCPPDDQGRPWATFAMCRGPGC